MKTTLDLPDDLVRRVKLRAVHRRRKLKDEVAQLLEAGMAQASGPEAPRKPPRPVRLRGRRRLSTRDIESAIGAGRE
jgi:plasmid stability protein